MNNQQDVDYDHSECVGQKQVLGVLEESVAEHIRVWAHEHQMGCLDADTIVRLFWQGLLD